MGAAGGAPGPKAGVVEGIDEKACEPKAGVLAGAGAGSPKVGAAGAGALPVPKVVPLPPKGAGVNAGKDPVAPPVGPVEGLAAPLAPKAEAPNRGAGAGAGMVAPPEVLLTSMVMLLPEVPPPGNGPLGGRSGKVNGADGVVVVVEEADAVEKVPPPPNEKVLVLEPP